MAFWSFGSYRGWGSFFAFFLVTRAKALSSSEAIVVAPVLMAFTVDAGWAAAFGVGLGCLLFRKSLRVGFCPGGGEALGTVERRAREWWMALG